VLANADAVQTVAPVNHTGQAQNNWFTPHVTVDKNVPVLQI